MHRTDVWTVIMRGRCYHSVLLICLTSCWKENTTHASAHGGGEVKMVFLQENERALHGEVGKE